MFMMTDPIKARLILEMGLAEWRKQETLKRQKTSLNQFADYLGYSRPAVSLWLNGNNEITEDALISLLPKLSTLLGLEIYDELGYKRPNELHQYADRHWDDVPLKEQKRIAEIIAKYTAEPPPDEKKTKPPKS